LEPEYIGTQLYLLNRENSNLKVILIIPFIFSILMLGPLDTSLTLEELLLPGIPGS
jgi:hypothetical protein